MLQQVAVVARQLDRQAVWPEVEPLGDHGAVGLGVGDPGRRVRGEVGVFPEDVLRAHVLAQLDEKACPAHERVERKVRLHRIELLGREKALAERRHAEIDETVLQAAAAETAPADRVNARSGQRIENVSAHARSRRY
jgi:hypothetical protein